MAKKTHRWKNYRSASLVSAQTHVFRREFEQRVKQLAGLCAFALQKTTYPILSQLIAAVPPIALCRTL
jgi:hypothetical protein